MTEQFWMVYGKGKAMPTHEHATEQLATAEAERLARNHPGVEFVVLEAVALRCVDSMMRRDFRREQELPF